MRALIVIVPVLFSVWSGFSQANNYEPAFWKLLSVNGRVELLGTYRTTNTNSIGIENKANNTFLSGKLDVDSKSYFWHPNFLILDVGATYFPGAGKNNSILQPDYAIENVSKQIRLRTTFFRKKKLSYGTFLNYTDSYSNSENISENINNAFEYGGEINFRNKIAPVKLNYIHFNREQDQKTFNRFYKNKGSELKVNSDMSITRHDTHKLLFSQRNYNNTLLNVYDNTINTTTLNLRDRIYFNKKEGSFFTSFINKINSMGFLPYERFNIVESLNYSLPLNFRMLGRYDYNNITRSSQGKKTRIVGGTIQHKLYESLNTDVSYEHINHEQTHFIEQSNIFKYGIHYTKKIPLRGRLNVTYNYLQNDIDRDGFVFETPFFNESYILSDGDRILLEYPDIVESSIVVKDNTGALIFQQNVDYILIQQGAYFEIQRLPGGGISNNEQVFVDFIANNSGDYNYRLLSKRFYTSLQLFNNLINVYYKKNNRDYKDIDLNFANADILNYIDQKVVGAKIKYRSIEIGAEKDTYESNIVPYKLNSYFANMNGRFSYKMRYGFNALVKDYEMIGEEGRSQLYMSASGNLSYNFNYKTRLNIIAGYRKQEGEGIDLELFTARADLSTSFNQLLVRLSADLYRRNYLLTEDYNYNAINLRIIRKF